MFVIMAQDLKLFARLVGTVLADSYLPKNGS